MTEAIKIGDRVQVFLTSKVWVNEGWFNGVVIRIDPYSAHRSFYWVELDEYALSLLGLRQISILNPKNIRKV